MRYDRQVSPGASMYSVYERADKMVRADGTEAHILSDRQGAGRIQFVRDHQPVASLTRELDSFRDTAGATWGVEVKKDRIVMSSPERVVDWRADGRTVSRMDVHDTYPEPLKPRREIKAEGGYTAEYWACVDERGRREWPMGELTRTDEGSRTEFLYQSFRYDPKGPIRRPITGYQGAPESIYFSPGKSYRMTIDRNENGVRRVELPGHEVWERGRSVSDNRYEWKVTRDGQPMQSFEGSVEAHQRVLTRTMFDAQGRRTMEDRDYARTLATEALPEKDRRYTPPRHEVDTNPNLAWLEQKQREAESRGAPRLSFGEFHDLYRHTMDRTLKVWERSVARRRQFLEDTVRARNGIDARTPVYGPGAPSLAANDLHDAARMGLRGEETGLRLMRDAHTAGNFQALDSLYRARFHMPTDGTERYNPFGALDKRLEAYAGANPNFAEWTNAVGRGVENFLKDMADHPHMLIGAIGLTIAFPEIMIPVMTTAGVFNMAAKGGIGAYNIIQGYHRGNPSQILGGATTLTEGGVEALLLFGPHLIHKGVARFKTEVEPGPVAKPATVESPPPRVKAPEQPGPGDAYVARFKEHIQSSGVRIQKTGVDEAGVLRLFDDTGRKWTVRRLNVSASEEMMLSHLRQWTRDGRGVALDVGGVSPERSQAFMDMLYKKDPALYSRVRKVDPYGTDARKLAGRLNIAPEEGHVLADVLDRMPRSPRSVLAGEEPLQPFVRDAWLERARRLGETPRPGDKPKTPEWIVEDHDGVFRVGEVKNQVEPDVAGAMEKFEIAHEALARKQGQYYRRTFDLYVRRGARMPDGYSVGKDGFLLEKGQPAKVAGTRVRVREVDFAPDPTPRAPASKPPSDAPAPAGERPRYGLWPSLSSLWGN